MAVCFRVVLSLTGPENQFMQLSRSDFDVRLKTKVADKEEEEQGQRRSSDCYKHKIKHNTL